MNRFNLLSLFAVMMALSVSSYAQSTDDEAATEQTDDTQSATDDAEQRRPSMPNLFFRQEQRRVLEAVRQGVVQEQDFEVQGFVPVVILEEVLDADLPVEEQVVLTRDQSVRFDAYIVSHKTGKTVLWVNGQPLKLEDDLDVLYRDGVAVGEVEGEEVEAFSNGVLQGDDNYSRSGFKMRVGQVLSTDGFVEETLPIVIKKRN